MSSSDSDCEDHSSPTEACDNVAVKKAVKPILQWSVQFGASDAGATELFSLLHKSFAILGDDAVSGIPNTLDKAIAMVRKSWQATQNVRVSSVSRMPFGIW